MAVDMFINIGTIESESISEGHKKEIDVLESTLPHSRIG